MPVIFDEVTAEVSDEERSPQAPVGEKEPGKSELQEEERLRRFLRKLNERCARLFVD
jgi:hypothetical protein